MNADQLIAWARGLTLAQIEAAGVERMRVLGAFGSAGVPLDAHNAIVDLAHLLAEALRRAGHKSDEPPVVIVTPAE